jgi:hypothetical protein
MERTREDAANNDYWFERRQPLALQSHEAVDSLRMGDVCCVSGA